MKLHDSNDTRLPFGKGSGYLQYTPTGETVRSRDPPVFGAFCEGGSTPLVLLIRILCTANLGCAGALRGDSRPTRARGVLALLLDALTHSLSLPLSLSLSLSLSPSLPLSPSPSLSLSLPLSRCASRPIGALPTLASSC